MGASSRQKTNDRMTGASGARARRLGRLLRAERGTAVVEFAIVAIPLFLVVFGVIDFGRALNYYNDMTQLAGQGARAAAVNQNVDGTAANANFQKLVADEADSPELTNPSNHLSVCVNAVPSGSPPTGKPVTIEVHYQFRFIPLVRPVSITLSAQQTERYEAAAAPGYTSGCAGP